MKALARSHQERSPDGWALPRAGDLGRRAMNGTRARRRGRCTEAPSGGDRRPPRAGGRRRGRRRRRRRARRRRPRRAAAKEEDEPRARRASEIRRRAASCRKGLSEGARWRRWPPSWRRRRRRPDRGARRARRRRCPTARRFAEPENAEGKRRGEKLTRSMTIKLPTAAEASLKAQLEARRRMDEDGLTAAEAAAEAAEAVKAAKKARIQRRRESLCAGDTWEDLHGQKEGPGRMTLGRATGEWHVQESSVQGPGGRRRRRRRPAAAGDDARGGRRSPRRVSVSGVSL